jgi:alpha-beta hydrolase superfamily lysophospholipase
VTDTFDLRTSGDSAVVVYRWLPDRVARGVVQIAHGAAEHAARYERLANDLNGAGFAVYANDHRGHGRTAGDLARFGIGGEGCWQGMVDDAKDLTEHVASGHPGLPIVLLGHSMGSFIAQDYLQRWGTAMKERGLRGFVLTGSASSLPPEAEGLRDRVEAALQAEGSDAPSMDFAMMFSNFNDPFVDTTPETAPTGFEWLSRDPDEVRKYVDDPWCGNPLSNGFVLDMAGSIEQLWSEEGMSRVPADLAALIMSGGEDPVGGDQADSVRRLAELYRNAGLYVTERIYEGARHEIFNETNRDEVTRDLIAWLDEVVTRRSRATG